MNIESVYDPSFKPYGQALTGYNTAALVSAMEAIPLPEEGVAYEPSIAALEASAIFGQLQNNAYGGMPVQIGMCWGRNTRLNCLEYQYGRTKSTSGPATLSSCWQNRTRSWTASWTPPGSGLSAFPPVWR